MKRSQALKESYEYLVSPEDIPGIKRIATSGLKKLIILVSVFTITATVLLIFLYSRTMACSALTAGIILIIFLATALVNTNRGFEKTKHAPDDLLYKLRIYDDFIVCERSNENGISLLSTGSAYDAAALGENEKYIVINTGVYAIPVPKDLLNTNSLIYHLCSLKGAKQKKPSDVPEVFIEPRRAPTDDNSCPHPCEIESEAIHFDSVDTQNAETEENHPEKLETVYSGADHSEDADIHEDNCSDTCGNTKADEAATSCLYERFFTNSKDKKLKTVGRIAFVLSLLSIFAAPIIGIVSAITNSSATLPLIIISLLPVSSIIIGFLLLRKRESWGKNILAGAVALIVILSVNPTDIYVPDEDMITEALAYVESIESALDIDLPEMSEIYYYSLHTDNSIDLSGAVSAEAQNAFIEYAKTNPKFIGALPSTHVGLLPDYYRENDSTVALVYNKTTGEYNALPEQAGTYRMIYVTLNTYTGDSVYLDIYEYDLKYETEFTQP